MLDMATSVASNGKLKQALREKKPIPEGWALDAQGNSTTDPAKAAISLPIGGPKGAGLGLMFECVTSVLAGAPLLANMLGPGKKSFHMQSEMFIAIDASKFRALRRLRERHRSARRRHQGPAARGRGAADPAARASGRKKKRGAAGTRACRSRRACARSSRSLRANAASRRPHTHHMTGRGT